MDGVDRSVPGNSGDGRERVRPRSVEELAGCCADCGGGVIVGEKRCCEWEGCEGSCGSGGGCGEGWAGICEKTDAKATLNRRETDLKPTVKRREIDIEPTVNRRERDGVARIADRVDGWGCGRIGDGEGGRWEDGEMGGWEARKERGWWLREKTASDTPFFPSLRFPAAVRFLDEFVRPKFGFFSGPQDVRMLRREAKQSVANLPRPRIVRWMVSNRSKRRALETQARGTNGATDADYGPSQLTNGHLSCVPRYLGAC